MDRVAILRFLLAVLYWCQGNPPEDVREKRIDFERIRVKLNEDCKRFNLLGEGKRFYQESGVRTKQTAHTVNYLIHEIPTGTNKWHFKHSADKMDGLCPACCALGLLRLPCFATSAGKGKSPGINAKPPLYFISDRNSIWETLQTEWVSISDLGLPEWEKPGQSLSTRGDVSILLGLTWLPRRVWLADLTGQKRHCMNCGRQEYIITHCVFDGKGSTKTSDEETERNWRDPHVSYSKSKKDKKTSLHLADALGSPDAASGDWVSIMISEKALGRTDSVEATGFASVQNDKYLEATSRLLTNSGLGKPENIEKLKGWNDDGRLWKAKNEKKPHSNFSRRLRPKYKEKQQREHCEITSLVTSIRPHIEHIVFQHIDELLKGGDEDWQKAADEYEPFIKAAAQSLSPGFTTAAVERRNHIAKVRPDMRPREEKSSRKQKEKSDE